MGRTVPVVEGQSIRSEWSGLVTEPPVVCQTAERKLRRVVMRKKIGIVVAVAMLSTLAACGGGEESDNESPDSTEVLVKNRPKGSQQITVTGGGRRP